ncbi:MAG: MATE family efflux transporter [Burkholderiales bacterium]
MITNNARPASSPKSGSSAMQRILAETRALLAIGGPLVVNNLCTIGLQTIDTVMAGQLGARDLAAVAIGGHFWVPLFLFGMGVLMAVSPLASFHWGAHEPQAIGHVARQAAWLSVLVSGVLIAILSLDNLVFGLLDLEPDVLKRARGFIDAIAWGLPAACLFQVLRFTGAATGYTVPIMVLSVLALPLNAALNWVLMYGKLGLPPLGVVGCGWATTIVHVWICLTLTVWMWRGRIYRRLALFSAWEWPQPSALRHQLRLGLPIGIGIFLEAALFGSVALLMGALGTRVVAAHQIAINYAALMFMVPLGISVALTVRIGHALGAGEGARTRFIGAVGYALCVAFALVSAAVMLLFPAQIVKLYTADNAVSIIAAGLLGVAAIFQVSDSLQIAAAGALRGLQDTHVPMLINAMSYWGIGFPLAWLFGITLNHGPRGVWAGLVLALTVAAMLLLARFYWLTRERNPERLQAPMRTTHEA